MIVDLTPMRRDDSLTLARQGDVLWVNGTAHDFSAVAEGAVLARDAVGCDWLASDVTRVAGRLRLTLIAPHGPDAPEEQLQNRTLDLSSDGPIQTA